MKLYFTDVVAAISTSILYTIGAYSFATLIFSGPLSHYLTHGFNLILISNIVACLFGARLSSYPILASLTQPVELTIFALISTVLVANMTSLSPGIDPIYTLYAVMVILTASVGLCLWGLGKFQMGNIVRFIPYPVIVAFLAASGWVLIDFSLKLIFGKFIAELQWSSINEHLLIQLGLSGCIVIAIMIFQKWFSRALIEPIIYLLSLFLFYSIVFASGSSIEHLKETGWYILTIHDNTFPSPFEMFDLAKIQWKAFLDWRIIGNALALFVIAPLFILLTLNGIERETQHEFDYDHELKYTGLSNIVMILLGGGAISTVSLSGTLRNYQLGAKSRWVGFLIALFFGIAVIFGAFVLKMIPLFIVASLPLMTGVTLLRNWLINTKGRLSLPDYGLLWLIFIVIVVYGFLMGIIVGVIASLLLFNYRYSRINIIRSTLTGLQLHSNVERGLAAESLLRGLRSGIEIFSLQGYLFFGNINKLVMSIIHRIEQPNPQKLYFIILDFRNIQGIDPSSIESFYRLYNHTKKQGIKLVFTNLPNVLFELILKYLKLPKDNEYCVNFPTLDYGLEWCEDTILKQKTLNWNTYFSGQLQTVFPDEAELNLFKSYLDPLKVSKGTVIFTENEKLNKLYFLESGILTMQVTDEMGQKTRVKTIYPGVFEGETGLYLGYRQAFSCVAKVECLVYSLSFEQLVKMENEQPKLALVFHRYMMCQTLNRLIHVHKTVLSLL